MSTPELSSKSVRDTLQTISDAHIRIYVIENDEVRPFAIDTVNEAMTMSDEDLMSAVMDMDANEDGNERIANEIIGHGKLHKNFGDVRDNPPEKYVGDKDRIEAYAMDCLRIDYAIRKFRVDYPEHLGIYSSDYDESEDIKQGMSLVLRLAIDYLTMRQEAEESNRVEGQADGVS